MADDRNPKSVLDAVRELAPSITARSAEIESGRRVPGDLLAQLIAAGCFRMLTPMSHGGLELDLPASMEIIETLAAADGAVGWTVMIGSESPMLLALLPRRRFDEIYSEGPDVIVGGGFAPRGQAELTRDQYTVNGRWAFCSGCQHSRWLLGNCVVTENGQPRPGLMPGSNEIRAMLFRADQATIIDTWNVNGLRGTGSHDIEVKDLRVPAFESLDIFFGQPCIPGALYKAPVVSFALHIGAVGLGIARHALADIVTLVQTNKKRLYTGSAIADSPVFHFKLAEAETSLRAAYALLMEEACAVSRTSATGYAPLPPEMARVVGSVTWAAKTAAAVVDFCYTAGGGTAPYLSSPLQRHLRDIHTLTQHAAVNESMLTRAGAFLSGKFPDFSV
ncbi:MAG: acyl-CoA dehydrogenase family protein [Candidatus Binataceae bacterium]